MLLDLVFILKCRTVGGKSEKENVLTLFIHSRTLHQENSTSTTPHVLFPGGRVTFTGPTGTNKVEEAAALRKLFGDMEVQNEVLMKPQGNLQGTVRETGSRRQNMTIVSQWSGSPICRTAAVTGWTSCWLGFRNKKETSE